MTISQLCSSGIISFDDIYIDDEYASATVYYSVPRKEFPVELIAGDPGAATAFQIALEVPKTALDGADLSPWGASLLTELDGSVMDCMDLDISGSDAEALFSVYCASNKKGNKYES